MRLDVQGETVMTQHYDHMMTDNAIAAACPSNEIASVRQALRPDVAQKDSGHQTPVALPVSMTLVIAKPLCVDTVREGWSLTPPQQGRRQPSVFAGFASRKLLIR